MIYRKLMQAAGGNAREPDLSYVSFSQSTTRLIGYPSDVAAGNLLVHINFASGSNAVDNGNPVGFTGITGGTSSVTQVQFAFRIADGTEAGTILGRRENDNIYQYMINFAGPVTSLLRTGDSVFAAADNPVDTSAYGSPSIMFNAELNGSGAGPVGFASGTDTTISTITNMAVGFTLFEETPSSVTALSDLGSPLSVARSCFLIFHTIE